MITEPAILSSEQKNYLTRQFLFILAAYVNPRWWRLFCHQRECRFSAVTSWLKRDCLFTDNLP